jgi:hypothetical protein
MEDLEDMAAKLLETARKLPPGLDRHDLLKQIGTFRAKLVAIAASRRRSHIDEARTENLPQ